MSNNQFSLNKGNAETRKPTYNDNYRRIVCGRLYSPLLERSNQKGKETKINQIHAHDY
jgi:hypothetical protein